MAINTIIKYSKEPSEDHVFINKIENEITVNTILCITITTLISLLIMTIGLSSTTYTKCYIVDYNVKNMVDYSYTYSKECNYDMCDRGYYNSTNLQNNTFCCMPDGKVIERKEYPVYNFTFIMDEYKINTDVSCLYNTNKCKTEYDIIMNNGVIGCYYFTQNNKLTYKINQYVPHELRNTSNKIASLLFLLIIGFSIHSFNRDMNHNIIKLITKLLRKIKHNYDNDTHANYFYQHIYLMRKICEEVLARNNFKKNSDNGYETEWVEMD